MFLAFPFEWSGSNTDGSGNPPVSDPGTIYVLRDEFVRNDWPNDSYDAPEIAHVSSLSEMVESCLELWRDADGFTPEENFPQSDAIAQALRDAADKLDSAKRPITR